jgi:ribosomal protein S18 acetylase RimI-like enzyme
MTTRLIEARTAEEIADVRELFTEYAESLGWDLSQGGHFADEIRDLPGPYAQPAGSLLLAYVDEEPAGALGLQPVPLDARISGIGAEHFGELKRLYVRPEFRRAGIAQALMERAEVEARRRGYDRLVLTTSEEMFPLAQGLYDRLGYEVTREYRDDMPYPHIRWMQKCL